MSDLRIATRASRLALAQADEVARLLRAAHSDLEMSIVEVATTGDRDRISSVATLTEVGAFVRAVQQTVLAGEADIAVHSCKDLPVEGPSDLAVFYPAREAPWDVLCGHDLESLPGGARVGTGSPRRTAQLRLLRPDLEVEDIRGNVDTRLEKVHSGEYDAVVLAEAGLRRLRREDEIGHRFSLGEMVPAPAQAALAVEAGVAGPAAGFLQAIDDPRVRRAVEAERALLALTRAGCRSALGAYGVVRDDEITMTGFVEDERGPRFAQAEGAGPEEAARNLQAALEL
ncbi:MAG: hydroxymethylbilane synthase [Actinobacteria bacterium]|nr:hydroxymethylbilane synthase [Actinomycetota bacterium]